MASIALSSIPGTGRELEDYVASMLQAAGYFVEKNSAAPESPGILGLAHRCLTIA